VLKRTALYITKYSSFQKVKKVYFYTTVGSKALAISNSIFEKTHISFSRSPLRLIREALSTGPIRIILPIAPSLIFCVFFFASVSCRFFLSPSSVTLPSISVNLSLYFILTFQRIYFPWCSPQQPISSEFFSAVENQWTGMSYLLSLVQLKN